MRKVTTSKMGISTLKIFNHDLCICSGEK